MENIKSKLINKKKYFIIAFLLMSLVLILYSVLFPTKKDTNLFVKQYLADTGIALTWPFPQQVGVYKLLYADTDGADTFHADGAVTSWFGPRVIDGEDDFHEAIDIVSKGGSNIVCAVQAGVVTMAEWNSGYGYTVEISHDGGYTSKYSHLASLMVSAGQTVTVSQALGVEGGTGGSGYAIHLDLRIFKNGTYYDPAQFFNLDLSSKGSIVPTEGVVVGGGSGSGSGSGGSAGKPVNSKKLTKQAWQYYASYATMPVPALDESKSTTSGGGTGTTTDSDITSKNPETGSADWPNKGTNKLVDYKGKKILIVNKNYGLSDGFESLISGEVAEAEQKFSEMASASGLFSVGDATRYRSASIQQGLYDKEIAETGIPEAYYWTAKPGYSEHQTSLAWDMKGYVTDYGTGQDEQARELAKGTIPVWLAANAYQYGFIIRYPDNKKNITGYGYEPWHVRYVGVELATELKNNGQTLEEFFASQL